MAENVVLARCVAWRKWGSGQTWEVLKSTGTFCSKSKLGYPKCCSNPWPQLFKISILMCFNHHQNYLRQNWLYITRFRYPTPSHMAQACLLGGVSLTFRELPKLSHENTPCQKSHLWWEFRAETLYMALGLRTKFQLGILITSMTSAAHKFWENILESLQNVRETTPGFPGTAGKWY